MLKKNVLEILETAQDQGWVMEPEAKRLLSLSGIRVPRYLWSQDLEEVTSFADNIGYPVVVKVVSPDVVHKSDTGGVLTGIVHEDRLREAFTQMKGMKGFEGVLVEETVTGIELIIGGKMDYQFGPVVLLGMGGTAAEIYRDTSLRMAPLKRNDVLSMVDSLTARPLLEGYRGSEPVDLEKLIQLVITFSDLLMELEGRIESIDLNPVMCSSENCVVADARIMLRG
jgi:acyl-CoA synthetase (NDP forming)